MNANSSVDAFGDRIEWVINQLGGPGQAAQKIGTTYTTLKRWRTNDADPSRTNLIRIAEAANIDINWLVTGEGSPAKTTAEQPTSAHIGDEYVYVPGYDIEVSAGHGMFTDGAIKPDRYLAFRRRWTKARGLDPKQLIVLFVRGDSMEPTIVNGAAIVVNLLKKQAMDGKIYVVRISDRLWVKRIQWTPDGGLRLISDNKEVYNPFDISKNDLEHEDIEIIGQVIHTSYDLPD